MHELVQSAKSKSRRQRSRCGTSVVSGRCARYGTSTSTNATRSCMSSTRVTSLASPRRGTHCVGPLLSQCMQCIVHRLQCMPGVRENAQAFSLPRFLATHAHPPQRTHACTHRHEYAHTKRLTDGRTDGRTHMRRASAPTGMALCTFFSIFAHHSCKRITIACPVVIVSQGSHWSTPIYGMCLCSSW